MIFQLVLDIFSFFLCWQLIVMGDTMANKWTQKGVNGLSLRITKAAYDKVKDFPNRPIYPFCITTQQKFKRHLHQINDLLPQDYTSGAKKLQTREQMRTMKLTDLHDNLPTKKKAKRTNNTLEDGQATMELYDLDEEEDVQMPPVDSQPATTAMIVNTLNQAAAKVISSE